MITSTWHFHGSFHLQKIIVVQNQYYTRLYNKGGSRMTLRRTSITAYFMECVHNHETLCFCNFKFPFSFLLLFVFWQYVITEKPFFNFLQCLEKESITNPWLALIMESQYDIIYMYIEHQRECIFDKFLAVYKAISNLSFTSNPSIWNQPDLFDTLHLFFKC